MAAGEPSRSKKVTPITPNEIQGIKNSAIPKEMIEAVNALIVENWNGTTAHFKQTDLSKRYLSLVKNRKKAEEEMYKLHHLDIEPIFRKAGWSVDFDRPGYNESYEANFTFSK